ncbi:hypothetical protein [Desulfobacula sp.]|nr:hypothetical protein [Desulfobacula sp.]
MNIKVEPVGLVELVAQPKKDQNPPETQLQYEKFSPTPKAISGQ